MAGTVTVIVFLSEATSANLIGITFGLLWWSLGLYYAGGSGWDRWRKWKFNRSDVAAVMSMTVLWPAVFLTSRAQNTIARLRLLKSPQDEALKRHERQQRQLIIARFFFIALCCWIVGTGVILQMESFGFVVGIMAGPAFLAAAWWLFRRLRRNYARFVTARQFDQLLAHLVGSLVLAASGMAILLAVI